MKVNWNSAKQLINNYSDRKFSVFSIHVNKENLAYKALELTSVPSKTILITAIMDIYW